MIESCIYKGRARELQPPFKGPYMVICINGQNVNCMPFDGNPIKVIHISILMHLKGETGRGQTFIPDLLDIDGSCESNIKIPFASLLGRQAWDLNPSPNIGNILLEINLLTMLFD